jgi:membrane protease YdiL (CAAX protease family)
VSKNVYLALADQGKNAWWRYGMGIVLTLVVWMIGTAFLTVPFQESGLLVPGSVAEFALSLLTFGLMLLGVWLAVAWLHRRPFGSLIGPSRRLNGKRLLLGAGIWAGLFILVTLGNVIFMGVRYTFNADFLQYWPYLLVALALIPLQTSTEEFFFRGYLLQASGRLTQNWLVLSVINGVLFTLPHLGNVEVELNFLFSVLNWFLVGAGWTLITLCSGSLDYALGIHAINNLLLTVIFGYEGGSLPPIALFMTQGQITLYDIVSLFAALAAAYWLISRLESRSAKEAVSSQS